MCEHSRSRICKATSGWKYVHRYMFIFINVIRHSIYAHIYNKNMSTLFLCAYQYILHNCFNLRTFGCTDSCLQSCLHRHVRLIYLTALAVWLLGLLCGFPLYPCSARSSTCTASGFLRGPFRRPGVSPVHISSGTREASPPSDLGSISRARGPVGMRSSCELLLKPYLLHSKNAAVGALYVRMGWNCNLRCMHISNRNLNTDVAVGEGCLFLEVIPQVSTQGRISLKSSI